MSGLGAAVDARDVGGGLALRAAASAPSLEAGPLVAVLCPPSRAQAAAAGLALGLARALRRPCAFACVVGDGAVGRGGGGGFRAARQAAAALRTRGLDGVAGGRLVWLPDRRAPRSPHEAASHAVGIDDVSTTSCAVPDSTAHAAGTEDDAVKGVAAEDVATRAAALSAELGRSVAAVGGAGAIAIPFARTCALDRVLAWHDALVVVHEAEASTRVLERALTSLAALDRPVTAMAPPRRLAAMLAVAGLRAPVEATHAIGELGLVR